MANNRATYVPGGNDDFYLPELVSPAPKRVMPEVPDNIQENLARLELDGGPVNSRLSGLQSPPPVAEMPGSGAPSFPSRTSSISTLAFEQGQNGMPSHNGYEGRENISALENPTFSPFPRLKKRSPNVPPSDEDREAILEKAREPVLNSNDPEMQLTWAQDALAYVEVAMQNNVRVSDHPGSRPQTPQLEHQLRIDAVNVVTFLADQHHPRAEFIRGMWLEFGKFGFRLDRKEAYHSFTRSAQKGYARAEYRIGMQFETSNDPENAIRHYNYGVQAQDSASSYRMGMMYLLGQHGRPLDQQRGVQLIRFAAETADENAPQGAYVFGMLQARELPQVDVPENVLPFDLGAARFNIEKAAYLGFAKAQTKMGAAYELCQLGCDFDPALSLHYNALAARQGEPEADMAISKWFLCGYEGIFEKNEELAFTYARRAAQTGLPTAEFALGYFYEIGVYIPVDVKEAKTWYEKASEHGNKDAVGRLEGISRSNTLSKKDHHGAAIAKIQSQYGSHRGKRPERFKAPSTPMPTIADSPDPGQYGRRTGMTQRPPSTAPYPDDDVVPHPRPQLPYASSNSALDVRPYSSASGRPVSDSNYRAPSTASPGPPRPYSHMDNIGFGRGRGSPSGAVPGALGSQGYRQPSSGPLSVQNPAVAVHEPPRPQSAGVSVGYSAPLDPTGPDGRKKIQKRGPPSGSANSSNLRPLPPHTNTSVLPDRSSGQRLSSLPHSQTFAGDGRPQNGRPVSAGMPGSPSPNIPGPRPSTAMQNPGIPPVRPNTGGPLPPPKITDNNRPTATPPPNVASAKPPGKGPKTFEEMGVPQAKRDGDCLMM